MNRNAPGKYELSLAPNEKELSGQLIQQFYEGSLKRYGIASEQVRMLSRLLTNGTAPNPAKETKTDLSVRTDGNNPARLSRDGPVAEFDAAAHHEETVKVAYRIWLERAYCPGSPEDDWSKAVNEVRAKYAGTGFNAHRGESGVSKSALGTIGWGAIR